MRVHLSDSASLRRLVDDLVASGCIPAAVGGETLEVIHPDASDVEEARTELTFFLRAWQAAHPEVELTYAAV